MVKKTTKDSGAQKVSKKECSDKHCPFHGSIKVRGRVFNGRVIKTSMRKTAIVEWQRTVLVPKYERFEKKRSRIKVHNPECINAKKGDFVKVAECRPISKTKSFVIIEVNNETNKYKNNKRAFAWLVCGSFR